MEQFSVGLVRNDKQYSGSVISVISVISVSGDDQSTQSRPNVVLLTRKETPTPTAGRGLQRNGLSQCCSWQMVSPAWLYLKPLSSGSVCVVWSSPPLAGEATPPASVSFLCGWMRPGQLVAGGAPVVTGLEISSLITESFLWSESGM